MLSVYAYPAGGDVLAGVTPGFCEWQNLPCASIAEIKMFWHKALCVQGRLFFCTFGEIFQTKEHLKNKFDVNELL